jgi:hypothetical protein
MDSYWQAERAAHAHTSGRANLPWAITKAFLQLHGVIGLYLVTETPLRIAQTYFRMSPPRHANYVDYVHS